MAIAFVQATSGTNLTGATATTATTAFINPTVSGNAILVSVANNGTPGTVTSVTDTQLNTYKKVVSSGAHPTAEIWAAFNIIGGSLNVVTANQGFNDGAIFAHEYSGLEPASGAVDVFLGAVESNAASMTVGPTDPTTTVNTLVFVAGEMDVVSLNSLTVGPGYSNFTTASSNSIRGAVESAIVSAPGAQTATMVMNTQGGASWRIAVAAFREARVGLGTNVGRYMRTHNGMSRSEVAN